MLIKQKADKNKRLMKTCFNNFGILTCKIYDLGCVIGKEKFSNS